MRMLEFTTYRDGQNQPVWVNPDLVTTVFAISDRGVVIESGGTSVAVGGSIAEVLARLRGPRDY